MSKQLRKTLSVFLSVMLLLSPMAFALPLAGAVDAAYEITEGEILTVDVSSYTTTYIKFIPADDAYYSFYSIDASLSSYSQLYDEDLNQLNYSYGYNNFNISYDLVAATTYYYGIHPYSTGSLDVRVCSIDDPLAGLTAIDVPVDIPTEVTIPAGGAVYLNFDEELNGDYILSADNGAALNAIYYNESFTQDWSSILSANPVKPIYLWFEEANYLRLASETEQTFTVTLQTRESYAAATATMLTENVAQQVSLPADNVPVFLSFTAAATGYYAFSGTNAAYVSCYVYDEQLGYQPYNAVQNTPLLYVVYLESGEACYLDLRSSAAQDFSVTVTTTEDYIGAAVEPLSLGVAQTVPINSDGGYVFKRFTPAVSGSYILTGTNTNFYAYPTLYDSNLNQFYGSYTTSQPMMMIATLAAGQTYCFKLYEASTSYDVTLMKTSEYFDAQATVLTPNTPASVTTVPNEDVILKFTAPTSGSYVLTGENESYINALRFASDFSSYDTAYGVEFMMPSSSMEAGKTYYYKLTSSTNQTFDVTVSSSADYLDNLSTPLTLDEAQSVTLPGNYRKTYVSFAPAVSGTYVLYGTNTDDYADCEIFDDSFETIYSPYSQSAPMVQFAPLEAGSTYYYALASYYGQTFDVTVTTLEDYLNDNSIALTQDVAQSVSLSGSGTPILMRFTPAADGAYTLCGTNTDYSAYCSVYDDAFESVSYNTDSLPTTCTATLSAGETYYYCLFSNSAQTFDVTMATTSDYMSSISKTLTLGEALNADSEDYLMFKPAADGVYVFTAENENNGLSATLYDGTLYSLANEYGAPATLFRNLEAGETYYYRVYDDSVCKVVSIDTFMAEHNGGALTLGEPVALTGSDKRMFTYSPTTEDEMILYGSATDGYFTGFWDDSSFDNNYGFGSSTFDQYRNFDEGDTAYIVIGLSNAEATGTFTLNTRAGYVASIAQPLTLDEPVTLTYDNNSNERYLSFTPEVTGRYTLTADNTRYISVTLYDSDMESISSDNSNEDLEFGYRLTAGETYYYRVYSYNTSFSLTLAKTCDHSVVELTPAVAPTCTTNGNTMGLICSDCGEWVLEPESVAKHHTDANKDRVCDVCEAPAIEFVAPCNNEGTVTATLYTDGELVLAGEGAVSKAPGKPVREDYESNDAYSKAWTLWSETMSTATSIAIPEGITSICAEAFNQGHFTEITIPASCTFVSENAFNNSRFEDITILNDALALNRQFEVEVHGPYMVNDQPVEFPLTLEQYKQQSLASMCAVYSVYLEYMIEEELEGVMEEYNITEEQARALMNSFIGMEIRFLGLEIGVDIPEGTTLAQAKVMLFDILNSILGTNFSTVGDLWNLEAAGEFEEIDEIFEHPTQALITAVTETFGMDLNGTFSGTTVYLGSEPEDGYEVFDGFTVHGNCGSTAQAAAQLLGASFDLLNHIPGEPVQENTVDATEESEGSYEEVVYCASCGIELSRTEKTIPALTHEHSAGDPVRENEVPATCSKAGSYDEVVYCTGCGNELSRTPHTIDKLQHTPGEQFTTNQVEPTCTAAGGYDVIVICTVCSTVLSSNHETVPANGHTPGEPVIENKVFEDCTEGGSYDEVVYCTVCGTEISREEKTIAPANHTPGAPVEEDRVESTCEVAGSYTEVLSCTVCGKLISSTPKTLPLAAHTPGAPVQENRVEPTCEKEGSYNEVIYCTVCNGKISSTPKTIAKTDHVDNDGDGKCDNCKQDLGTAKPQNNGNVCKWCGKVHEGFFQKIIGFFHKILAAILGARY